MNFTKEHEIFLEDVLACRVRAYNYKVANDLVEWGLIKKNKSKPGMYFLTDTGKDWLNNKNFVS